MAKPNRMPSRIDRQEAEDGSRSGNGERPGQVAFLEDEGHSAESGQDAQDVTDDGSERNEQ